MTFRRKQHGFTLIELLIVLAIIGFLAIAGTLGVVQYINNSRDAVRKSHLEKYRIALEDYFNDSGQYPPVEAIQNCGGNDLQPYLSEIYCDPLTKDPYNYSIGVGGKSYAMYALLSDTTDKIIEARGCDVGCGPDLDEDGRGDFNYGISSEQTAVGDINVEVVTPTCGGQNGAPYCFPNICAECCPGDTYRCNDAGTGCYRDYNCAVLQE